jgi:dethiobiotin synthetase
VLVAGTGTDVGKTWVSARLVEAWRGEGLIVAARKLAQSFEPGGGPTDAEVLALASGEAAEDVCPRHRWYPVPMAPPMAAETLGMRAPLLSELVGELSFGAAGGSADSIGLIETAGGVRSPQAADADVVDLVGLMRPDRVVLVADAGLGTINSVRLSAEALEASSPWPRGAGRLVVVLNRFDPDEKLHVMNRDWLSRRCGLEVHAPGGDGWAQVARRLAA